MTLTILDQLEQGTDEWLQARCGIVTASTMHNLVTPGGKVSESEAASTFIRQLAAERITGHPEITYPTRPMQRGTLLEPFARDDYAKNANVNVKEIGFMRSDTDVYTIGFSPDGLIGDDGLLEIKCPSPKEHIKTIMLGGVPPQYYMQVQTGLFVSGRKWLDFVSYCPGMHTFVRRIEPDDETFAAIASAAVRAEKVIRSITQVHDNIAARRDYPAPAWFDPFDFEDIF